MSAVSQTTLVPDDVFYSLTGHDENAIAQHFGNTVFDLAQGNGSMYLRSLIFVLKRRDGATDDEARNAALDMAMKEITDYFSEAIEAESEEDEQPEAESGKDEQPEEQPGTSLSSVS
jgi:hypothetical protein